MHLPTPAPPAAQDSTGSEDLVLFFNSCLSPHPPPGSDVSEKLLAFPADASDPGLLIENEQAARGNTLSPSACRKYGVSSSFLDEWLGGVRLAHAEPIPPYVCPDYPLVKKFSAEAGEEFDRLFKLNKIIWYPSGASPEDLSICPSNVIVKPDRLRVVHDWSHPDCRLNALLSQPPVSYGTLDSWLSNLKPSAWMAGLDLRDCFLHWPIHPSSRRFLGW